MVKNLYRGSCTVELEFEFITWTWVQVTSHPHSHYGPSSFFYLLIYICKWMQINGLCWILGRLSLLFLWTRGVLVLLKLYWAPDIVEFVLGRFSHFNIAITYSNSTFCGVWTPSFCEFTWKLSKFQQNEHTPGDRTRKPLPIAVSAVAWTQARLVNSNSTSRGKETPFITEPRTH